MRYTKCYVWSASSYRVKTWTPKTSLINKLKGFVMRCYLRMLKVSWSNRARNEEILRRMEKDREIRMRRKRAYFGRIMNNPKY